MTVQTSVFFSFSRIKNRALSYPYVTPITFLEHVPIFLYFFSERRDAIR